MGKYETIGIWSFYIGLIITILVALISPSVGYGRTLFAILAVLGIIVGLLNVQGKEVTTYLVASIALLLSAGSLVSLSAIVPVVGEMLSSFLQGLVVFVAPGAAIVSIRAFYDVAKSK